MLAGLAIGLSVAGYSYLQNRSEATSTKTVTTSPPPATSKGKEVETSAPKPQFDFYTILPEMEVVVPQRSEEKGAARAEKTGTYFLQAGSFRHYRDADNLKANLALLGVESKIETITINSKDTWHRVRAGPYTDLRKLNKIRTRLLNNNIEAITLKVGG